MSGGTPYVVGKRASSTETAGPPVPAPEQGWRASRRLLRGPLRILVGGQCLGQAADGLAQIAFAQFIVFEVGPGATPERITAVLAVTLLPFSLVGPFAGVLIDRWSRRRVLIVMSWVRAALILAAIATVTLQWEPGAFIGVLLLLSTSRLVLAAKGAALPRTVAPNELVTANAISAVAGMSAVFLGAVVGAGFVEASVSAGFVAASLLYLLASGVFARLPEVGGGNGREMLRRLRQVLIDVKDGLKTLGVPDIGRPLTAVWLHRLLLGAGFVILVLIADTEFGLGISGYALALGVTGVAAFIGSVTAPVLARRWPATTLLPVAFLPPAAAVYVGGLAPNLAVLVAGIGFTAFSFQLLKVLVDALVGRASPDEVRGRVFSVYDVLYNVAFVLAGLLMVPLWQPGQARELLWWLAAAFLASWLLFARVFSTWPFTGRTSVVRPARRWRGRVAALVAGALPVLAFPEPAWWWFAWVCLVPLLLVVRAAPTSREAAVRGWWGGAGYILATAYWLAPVTGPALPLVAFVIGSLWLPWGWAVRRMLAGKPSPATLLGATVVLPAGWVALEAIRSWPSLGGPWALLGASQWNQQQLLASAALGGIWLTGFLIVAVNVAIVATFAADGAIVRVGLIGIGVTALATGPLWAASRPAMTSSGEVRVAVVQPGVLGDAEARLERQLQLTEAVADERPDLIVWAESSVGYDLPSLPDLTDRLADLSRRTGADLLVNVDARRPGAGIYKTSILITPDGIADSYVKTRLVPFGEYIPLRPLLGWVANVSEAALLDRGRGDGAAVLEAGRLTLGALVCFESTFPDMARRQVDLGAELIVYQTASTTFQGTWAQPQHAALAAVRAVETGRPVVHSALTGTTAAYDAEGTRLVWIDPGQADSAVVPLKLTTGRTPYVVAGDWVLALSAGVIVVALIVASLRGAEGQARRR
ncbi:MAG TPA: apolipoprotein N-acyltransferase [Nocardioidaceae bacterium]|nr:apolipoprotein N-acyltransferase [Nocardioidaceae bacterium]